MVRFSTNTINNNGLSSLTPSVSVKKRVRRSKGNSGGVERTRCRERREIERNIDIQPEFYDKLIRKRGRLSTYDPKYCEKVVNLMSEGRTKYMVVKALGITYETLNKWSLDFVEFGEALKLGENLCRAWWEEQGRQALNSGKKFNTSVWIFTMKNMFGWRDVTQVEQNTNQTTELKVNFSGVSDDQLLSLEKDMEDLPPQQLREKLGLRLIDCSGGN